MKFLNKMGGHPFTLALVTALIIAVAMTCGATLFYLRTEMTYKRQVYESVTRLAVVLAFNVNGDDHKNLDSREKEDTAEYQKILAPLRRLRVQLPEIRYVYTLMMVQGKIRFGVDTTPQGDLEGDGVEDHAFLYDEYKEAPIEAKRVFVEGRPLVTSESYNDKWGSFYSGYAPIYDSTGAVVAVLGIDLKLEDYLKNISEFREQLLVSILVAFLLALITGLVIFRILKSARTAEEQYHIVSESVSDAIVMVDQQGQLIYINSAVATILGYRPDELIGESVMKIIPADLRQVYWDALDQYVAQSNRKLNVQTLELPASRKDGTRTFLEISISEFIREGKRYYTGVIRDVGRRKMMEQNEKEVMNSKMQFLSVVTHELRTPLTVIKESIGIVEEQIAGPLNAEQTKFLVIAKKNLTRLARLVNNVLDYQKLETNRTELYKEDVDVSELLTEVAKNFEIVAEEKNITISTKIEEHLPKMHIDRDRIIQVLSNFMDNAIKYTLPEKNIYIGAMKTDQAIKIFVQDEGAGISEGEIHKLFQVFSQLSNAKDVKIPGSGLGLSITKKIIELHGGAVGVNSVLGHGSIFYFTLPLPKNKE